jgi:hypothetical protein
MDRKLRGTDKSGRTSPREDAERQANTHINICTEQRRLSIRCLRTGIGRLLRCPCCHGQASNDADRRLPSVA